MVSEASNAFCISDGAPPQVLIVDTAPSLERPLTPLRRLWGRKQKLQSVQTLLDQFPKISGKLVHLSEPPVIRTGVPLTFTQERHFHGFSC